MILSWDGEGLQDEESGRGRAEGGNMGNAYLLDLRQGNLTTSINLKDIRMIYIISIFRNEVFDPHHWAIDLFGR